MVAQLGKRPIDLVENPAFAGLFAFGSLFRDLSELRLKHGLVLIASKALGDGRKVVRLLFVFSHRRPLESEFLEVVCP